MVAGSAGGDGIWGTADDALNDGVSIIGRQVGADQLLNTADDIVHFSFENITPDEGLSAPFNLWFVFFGQFFDHGLDLVVKGGSGTVFVPLQADDPLIAGADGVFGNGDDLPMSQRFMLLTRATNQPGPDGVLGTPDDVREHINQTSPFVDQNQTYASHPSHQVFLRAYEMRVVDEGLPTEHLAPFATGELITNRNLGADGEFGTADDVELGGMSTWAVVKAQARDLLGIQLTDYDAVNVPLILTDAYGKFVPGANGFAQLVTSLGADGALGGGDDTYLEGDPAANAGLGVSTATALRTGHMFLADIAHSASPFSSQTGLALAADADTVAGVDDHLAGTYDDELLGEHFMAGDGRVNENIALTAVHHVFHAEHNRLVDHIKAVILETASTGDVSFLNQWLTTTVGAVPADLSTLVWDGERVFQAARFGTEMQYQHLVFEEFARKVQPQVDVFLAEGQGYDTTIDASIVAEFAHTVYRFGHSMLVDDVDRFDPNFQSSDTGLTLIQAFLNPLAFDANGALTAEEAAGAIVRGTTRQVGNEIDEFKTEALRNNLLGLPLDLAAINLARGRDTGIPSLNAARAQFYEWTGDSQLKPYTSWIDFSQHLRHPEVADQLHRRLRDAWPITGQTTMDGKRAAAFAIVHRRGGQLSNGATIQPPVDRLAFLQRPGGGPHGVNDIDFWIGGLAEKQMPFGGLLGSTFNYVFENQLEKLQNGDRFYYLERTAGLNFLTELENNSFAKLIMANTDATHLPGDVFSTPAFILEVDQTQQYTGLGPDGGDDPIATRTAIAAGDPRQPQHRGTRPQLPEVHGRGPRGARRHRRQRHHHLQHRRRHALRRRRQRPARGRRRRRHDPRRRRRRHHHRPRRRGQPAGRRRQRRHQRRQQHRPDPRRLRQRLHRHRRGRRRDLRRRRQRLHPRRCRPTRWCSATKATTGSKAAWPTAAPARTSTCAGSTSSSATTSSSAARPSTAWTARAATTSWSAARAARWTASSAARASTGRASRATSSAANVDLNLRAFDETPVPLSAASTLARFESMEGLSGSALSDILRGDDADAAAIAGSGAQGSVLTNFALIDGLQDVLLNEISGAAR